MKLHKEICINFGIVLKLLILIHKKQFKINKKSIHDFIQEVLDQDFQYLIIITDKKDYMIIKQCITY